MVMVTVPAEQTRPGQHRRVLVVVDELVLRAITASRHLAELNPTVPSAPPPSVGPGHG